MASIEVTIRTDDDVTLLVRKPYEVTKDTHVFAGTREETSNFDEVFLEVIDDVNRLMKR